MSDTIKTRLCEEIRNSNLSTIEIAEKLVFHPK